MEILMDTHFLLWALFTPGKLTQQEKETLIEPENEVKVSNISFFEISLKVSLNKLKLNGASPDELPRVAEESGFSIEAIQTSTLASIHKLPRIEHQDPFDRLLVWQAIKNQDLFLTRDQKLAHYENFGLHLLAL